MSYKTIIVHLDDGPRCAARVELAACLATRFGSRLVGIAPTGLPDVILTMNSAVPDGVDCVALLAASLRERAQAASTAFEQRCTAASVAFFQASVVVDEAIDAVVRIGRCSDVVVLGQTDTSAAVDGVAFDFPQQVLLHTGAPVLVVPYVGSFPSLGRRALVAWKNTREAARALRDALPLLRVAEHVFLVEIGEVETEVPYDNTLDAVSTWLTSHGVKFKTHRELGLAGVGDSCCRVPLTSGST